MSGFATFYPATWAIPRLAAASSRAPMLQRGCPSRLLLPGSSPQLHTFVARAGTPESIIGRLNTEMKRIISVSDLQQRISDFGLIPIDPPTIVETERYIKSETVRWKEVLQTIGLAGSQ